MNKFQPVFMEEMSSPEIDQFLTCARVGRIGMILNKSPYIVPVGFGYSEGKTFFHTCQDGLKMKAIQSNTDICFEVDDSLSDGSLAKSVVIFCKAVYCDPLRVDTPKV